MMMMWLKLLTSLQPEHAFSLSHRGVVGSVEEDVTAALSAAQPAVSAAQLGIRTASATGDASVLEP
jgi:hypothetical protein